MLVVVAYLPALRGQFLWDDDDNIINRMPLLRSLDGLRRIWLEPGATQQYYPLTHTTFWLDYHLWGLHPLGFHVANVLLHACSALLLWMILRRLGVRGAWLGAALFALHPVCVESVAWITERKNSLSGVFFLGSVLAGIKFWLPNRDSFEDQLHEPDKVASTSLGPWKFYWLALIFYLCALWAKTATVGLPAVFVLLAWWKRGKVERRDFYLLAPFLAVGMAMSLITIHIETNMGTYGKDWDFSLVERCLIASRNVWFYLSKLIWPHPLMFIYPRWVIRDEQLRAYLPLAAGGAVLLLLWSKPDTWGRPMLFTIGYFVAMLLPLLGFFNVCFFQFSFVCDHFQYLASIGPLAMAAAGITNVLEYFGKQKPFIKAVVCGGLLLVLGALTWRQTGIYRDNETLWRDAVAHNPKAWMAWNNLGDVLADQGRFEEAIQEYRQVIEIMPDYAAAHYNLGVALISKGNIDEAIQQFNQALRIQPNFTAGRNKLGVALASKGDIDGAMECFRQAIQSNPDEPDAYCNLALTLSRLNRTAEAVAQYKRALEVSPPTAGTLNNLAWILASDPNSEIRNGIEAVRLAAQACELTQHHEAIMLGTLGAAYAEAGRFEEAAVAAQKAEALAMAAGNKELAGKNHQMAELFRSRRPYHETAAPAVTNTTRVGP